MLDRRLNAYRDDLADAILRGRVVAPRFVGGEPARVVVGRAPVWREPKVGGELDTYYHYGESLSVFDRSGGFAWCQSRRDRYVGYVSVEHIAMGTQREATHFVVTLGSHCYTAPDLRSPVVDFLPRHSAVVVVESGLTTRGTDYARLDAGGFIPARCLSPPPPRSHDIVAAA
ncbi:MAG TPA: hypothetical protein VHW90_14370, partial [Stellaceae bacterium]|nr:hypothetical protein [Stellaceae bacterium]